MAQYKIKSAYLTGNKSKRLYKFGEVVDESDLVKSNIPELIRLKCLELIKIEAPKEEAPKEEEPLKLNRTRKK